MGASARHCQSLNRFFPTDQGLRILHVEPDGHRERKAVGEAPGELALVKRPSLCEGEVSPGCVAACALFVSERRPHPCRPWGFLRVNPAVSYLAPAQFGGTRWGIGLVTLAPVVPSQSASFCPPARPPWFIRALGVPVWGWESTRTPSRKCSLLTGSFNGTKALLTQGSFQNTVFCGFHSQHLLGPRPLFLQRERGIQLRIKKSVFGSGFQHGTCESAQRKQSIRKTVRSGVFVFFSPFRSSPLNIKTIFQSL